MKESKYKFKEHSFLAVFSEIYTFYAKIQFTTYGNAMVLPLDLSTPWCVNMI